MNFIFKCFKSIINKKYDYRTINYELGKYIFNAKSIGKMISQTLGAIAFLLILLGLSNKDESTSPIISFGALTFSGLNLFVSCASNSNSIYKDFLLDHPGLVLEKCIYDEKGFPNYEFSTYGNYKINDYELDDNCKIDLSIVKNKSLRPGECTNETSNVDESKIRRISMVAILYTDLPYVIRQSSFYTLKRTSNTDIEEYFVIRKSLKFEIAKISLKDKEREENG